MFEEFTKPGAVNTIEKVIKILGPRGEADQKDVIEFVKNGDFADDFVADIYGYYLIDGQGVG